MGLASAFYLDYIDGELNGDLFAKNAEETDPEFIKRCMDSCGSDCNIVKVSRYYGLTWECLKCPEINFEFLRLIKF